MTAALENQPDRRMHARTIALCFVLNALNGADFLSISYAAPLILEQWRVSAQTFSLVFSLGLLGMTLGSLVLAPLADVVGRKILILIAIVLIASSMAATSLATDVNAIMGPRFVVGLGVGAMLASMTSLASEHASEQYRSLAVMVTTAGYPIGATAAAFAANAALPAYGWPALFVIMSVISAVMFPICLGGLPESAAFVRAGEEGGARGKGIRRAAARSAARLKSAMTVSRVPIRELLSFERRRATLLLWAAFMSALVTLYVLVSWIPTMAVDAGLRIEHAIYASAAYHLGSLVGRTALGWLSARYSATRLITVCFALAALLMPLFGAAHQPAALFLAGIFAIGVFAQGAFGGLYAVAAQAYPTACRATGARASWR